MVTEVATLGPKTTIDFFETQLSLVKEELREPTLLGVEKAIKELNIQTTEKCELIDYEMISKKYPFSLHKTLPWIVPILSPNW
jgi:hypothetical protein